MRKQHEVVIRVASPAKEFAHVELWRRAKRMLFISLVSTVVLWAGVALLPMQDPIHELVVVTVVLLSFPLLMLCLDYYKRFIDNGIYIGSRSLFVYHCGYTWTLVLPVKLAIDASGLKWVLSEVTDPLYNLELPQAAYPDLETQLGSRLTEGNLVSLRNTQRAGFEKYPS